MNLKLLPKGEVTHKLIESSYSKSEPSFADFEQPKYIRIKK